MAPRFRIQLKNGGDSAVNATTIDGEFRAEDWKLFCRFEEFAQELESAQWLRAGMNAGYKLHYEAGKDLRVEFSSKPSLAEVRELLHLLRPFVHDNEPTHFFRVLNRLREYLAHESLHAMITHWREAFSGRLQRQSYTISVNAVALNDEAALKLWLHGYEYHRDLDKREDFVAKFGGPPDELALAQFYSLLVDKVEAVLVAARFIRGLRNSPTVQASL